MRTMFLILAVLTGPAFGQLDYGAKATDKEAAVKMHFAIKLFRGNLNKSQEDFLLRAIVNRRSISEPEAAKLFSTEDLRDVFFGIGREDLSTFKRLYDKGTVAEKKDLWNTLSRDEQIDARRINFAWGVGYLKINEAQIDHLLRFSKALPTITKDEAAVYETEATGLFSQETGRLLFSSIGPFKPCGPATEQIRDCGCSVGSSFNVSCSGECNAGGGRCRTSGDGCGFAWLYPCDGICQAS